MHFERAAIGARQAIASERPNRPTQQDTQQKLPERARQVLRPLILRIGGPAKDHLRDDVSAAMHANAGSRSDTRDIARDIACRVSGANNKNTLAPESLGPFEIARMQAFSSEVTGIGRNKRLAMMSAAYDKLIENLLAAICTRQANRPAFVVALSRPVDPNRASDERRQVEPCGIALEVCPHLAMRRKNRKPAWEGMVLV